MIASPSVTLDQAVLRYPVGPFIKGSLKSQFLRLFGRRSDNRPAKTFHTALDGVSVAFRPGDKIGIVGRNGAGKSTLLRAIAGIYPLEAGKIEVHGSMQSLFDLGIGFEPESTGRENIVYRGLAMGCTPEVIAARTNDIVAFADLGEFIDMPVRMYSAGMVVRLGFAISTFLDGDILLIDEVFGAGDAAFQERATARMHDVLHRAQIVVFVSHNLGLLKQICNRALWLEHGKLRADGKPEEVCDAYMRATTGHG